MSLLVEGNVVPLVTLVLFTIITLFYIKKGKSGHIPYMKKLPATEAIEECIGRCAETSRPLLWTPGWPGTLKLASGYGGILIASLSILSYAAKMCARKGVRLICSTGQEEILPLLTDMLTEIYTIEGQVFEPSRDIFYLPDRSYQIGTVNVMEKENVGGTLIIGRIVSEAVIFAMTGRHVGAFQVGGTVAMNNVPFLIAGCEYVLIAEEVYAAGAILSGEAEQLNTIASQDVTKLIWLIMLFIGVITISLGSNIIVNLLKM